MKKLLFFVIISSNVIFSARYYVSTTGDNTTGLAWSTAYTSLQTALTAATASGDEVWVAAGTYYPGAATANAFSINEGVLVYGGFHGDETDILERINYRPGESNETILSGDIDHDGTLSGNSKHIFNINGGSWVAYASLDGFTLTGGYSDNSPGGNSGGAINSNGAKLTLVSCAFINNSAYLDGGAINATGSNINLIDCVFNQNTSTDVRGGSIAAGLSTLNLTNCVFSFSTALGDGGAIWTGSTNSTMTNCIFFECSSQRGAALWLEDALSTSNIINCTFNANHASDMEGAIVANNSHTVNVINTILWDNEIPEVDFVAGGIINVSYSCVQNGSGVFTGTGNIFTNPLFTNAGSYEFTILGTSPCADVGDNSTCTALFDFRGIGFDRKLNKTNGDPGVIDMGAFEYQYGLDILPVELTSFSASVKESKVLLNWQTASEINNYGFIVERKDPLNFPEGQVVWEEVEFVKGVGNSNSTKEYSFTDNLINLNPNPNANLVYRLKQIDNDGIYKYSKEIVVALNVNPAGYSLEQNYPNPFNPSTTIKFSIPAASKVVLGIYDMLGQRVTELLNENKDAGMHEILFNASSWTSGTYFYRLQAGEYILSKKLVLIK